MSASSWLRRSPARGRVLREGKVARVGLLGFGARDTAVGREDFRQALRDRGWVEGQNIVVEELGSAGKHSSWQPTFGDGTKPTRRVIARRDGTPVRRAADLKR